MSSELTEKMIEDAIQQAANNFGAPTVIYMSNGAGFSPYGSPIAPTYTLGKVLDHYFGRSVLEDPNGDHFILSEAATAFYNMGFDPRPDNA